MRSVDLQPILAPFKLDKNVIELKDFLEMVNPDLNSKKFGDFQDFFYFPLL